MRRSESATAGGLGHGRTCRQGFGGEQGLKGDGHRTQTKLAMLVHLISVAILKGAS